MCEYTTHIPIESMKHFRQHEPLLIQQFETNQWGPPIHTHNHFELVLIQAGSGSHIINNNRFTYQAGDVFLLNPSDHRYVVVDQRTRFCSLSFTEFYLQRLMTTGTMSWTHVNEQRWTISQPLIGSLVTDRMEQRNVQTLIEIILAEQQDSCPLFSNPIVESLMRTILSIVDRQLARHTAISVAPSATPAKLAHRMVTYVCRHITEPDLLRIEKMADVFNYSPSHLGALFKQQIGESIQQYIIRYKLKLVETRLSLSTMTISQIADEFGFSDVCHLNKLFKRYYQHTPTDYRRSLLN